jgi:hypothetical protein
MKILKTYYQKIDNSRLNVSHLTNDFRIICKEVKEDIESSEVTEVELELLQLEQDILDINKSIENGLTPKLKWNGEDEEGNIIELISPDFRKYGDKEKSYFGQRYTTTSNNYLKSEYGLYLLLTHNLVRNDDKAKLCLTIESLVEEYYAEAENNPELWSRFIYPAHKCWLDAFLILRRAGTPLQIQFEQLVKNIESKFLNYDINKKSCFHLTMFVVNSFSQYVKNVKGIIDENAVLSKLESQISNEGEGQEVIGISKLIIKFSNTFKLNTTTSYNALIGRTYEKAGDNEIENERWTGGVKSFEDALMYYKRDKVFVQSSFSFKKY